MQDDGVVQGKLDPELEALISELPDGKENDEDTSTEGTTGTENAESDKDKAEPEEESTESDEDGDTEDDAESDGEAAEEEGYTIDGDEGEEDSEPEQEITSNSTQEQKQNPSQLTPEQQYIADGVSAFKVTGTVGDKEVEYEILTTDQLPDGFKYSSDAAHDRAINATQRNELIAQQRQNEYRSQQTAKSAQAFKEAEDAADRSDIGQLQRDGVIDKFKADPNSADFENDPSVKLVQEVLDFKEAENDKYLKASQQGKPYKHIGFEEAYYKYIAKHPQEKVSPAQAKEDKERVASARRTNKTAGTAAKDNDNQAPDIFHSKRELDAYINGLSF